ncbi:integral membrane protein [Stachybotrys elegans]|uniref:Integral membrane protein n=1 Tax=Stachybotrys elegans TaxID=80388 RepID=A0A8K0STJ6_9HYPO|nr:integral membrane protein [Stachybotrys elegans]
MAGGRFVCVLLPLLLTLAAIVAFMVAALTGVAHNDLYLFHLDVEDLSIDRFTLENLVDDLGIDDRVNETLSDANDRISDAADRLGDDIGDLGQRIGGSRLMIRQDTQQDNITAATLGLSKSYDVSFWGYCYVDQSDDRHCTDTDVNWAMNTLNDTYMGEFTTPTGVRVEFPDEITGPLRAFRQLSRWTGIAVIVALVVLGAELVIGILSNFSRIISCITYIIGLLAIVMTGVAAGLATAQAVVVVGAVEATARRYGVRGSINGRFLSIVWIGFAFTLAASLFWLFTICCCKNERSSRRSRRSRRGSDGEKFLPTEGAYRPVGNDHEMTSGSGFYQPPPPATQYNSQTQYGAPRGADRSDIAYEPYSHRV